MDSVTTAAALPGPSIAPKELFRSSDACLTQVPKKTFIAVNILGRILLKFALKAVEFFNLLRIYGSPGSRQMCCCLSSNDTTCNSAWQLTTASPVISTESYFFLLLALLVTVALSFSYHQLLGNRLIQVTKEVKMQILWTERVMFTLKMVILLIFFAAAWIPTVPDCSEHSEGRIQPQMEFLFELIRPSAVGSTIFILPLAGLISDFERIYRVVRFLFRFMEIMEFSTRMESQRNISR